MRFTSTPRLSQNDLLSLVAFGATSADLRESPGTVLLGEAGKLLAQNVLGIEPGVAGLRISASASGDSPTELHGFPARSDRRPSAPAQNAPGREGEGARRVPAPGPLYLSGEYDRDGGYGADVVLRFRFR